MILSIGIKGELCSGIFVEIKPKGRSGFDYHQTIFEIHELYDVKGIDSIQIPAYFDNTIYNLDDMIKHIRLFPSDINRVPIHIVGEDGDKKIEHIYEVLDFLTENEAIASTDSPDPLKEKLTNDEFIKIVTKINDGPPTEEMTIHDQTNNWGPYRLLKTLRDCGYDVGTDLDNIKNNLSRYLFYKKLILIDNNPQLFKGSFDQPNANLNTNTNLKNKIVNNLKSIQNNKINIAVIDDEISKGWDKAYRGLLGDVCNLVTDLYPIYTKEQERDDALRESVFNGFYKNFDKQIKVNEFDIILLDLRLFEKASNDASDILAINEVSGIQLLKKIKELDPTVAVIICTASNKSWSSEKVHELGANGFWSKESIAFGISNEYSYCNLSSLVDLVKSSYKWSSDIRKIYNPLLSISNGMQKSNNLKIANRIDEKKKLLFSVFKKGEEKEKNKEILPSISSSHEVMYVIAYSIINEFVDLLQFIRQIKGDSSKSECGTKINNKIFCIYDKKENQYEITDEAEKVLNNLYEKLSYSVSKISDRDFDDSNFILFSILSIKRKYDSKFKALDFAEIFSKLRTKRNSSVLIHRKEFYKNKNNKSITFSDIVEVIDIYKLLFDSFYDRIKNYSKS